MATIYHGTPLTPRAALLDVCAGRAMCVSFYRPDDVEAVQAISPAIMFRQRRVFVLETGDAVRAGVGCGTGLVALFRVAGTTPIPPREVGGHSGHAGSAKPAQRCALERMAFRTTRFSAVAHGRAYRAPVAAVREIRPCMLGLDRRGEGHRLPGLSRTHGRGGSGFRQPLAGAAHDARDCGSLRLSLYQRGQHIACPERMAL